MPTGGGAGSGVANGAIKKGDWIRQMAVQSGALSAGGADQLLAEHPKEPGEAVFEYQSRITNALSPEDKHEVLYKLRERYEPVDYIAKGADQYRAEHGMPNPQEDLSEVRADLPKADQVAKAFDGLSDHSDDPHVRAVFDDFKRQSEEQYAFMTKPESEGGLGIKVDFTDKHDPYSSAEAQANDLRDNHHIEVESGLGGDHPLMSQDEYDRFRAVHDVFGHAGVGGGFDRHGEYQAWLQHMSMYDGIGQDGMASEYHGVNSSLWAGDHSPTGKAVVLPADLIREPFDSEGHLVGK